MTLTNFLTYVKQVFKRTDKDTEITQCYNDAILAVATVLPLGMYKYQSYASLVAKQEDYSLPSTLMHIIHPVRCLDGSASTDSGYALNHITKQEYDELYPNPNRTDPDITGDPADYCIYSGSILVGPLPSTGTDDLLEIDWTTVPTDQSSGSDTPALPDYWREVLKQMTLKRLYEMLELYQESQYWRGLYEDPLGNPIGEFRRLLTIEKDKEGHSVTQVATNQL